MRGEFKQGCPVHDKVDGPDKMTEQEMIDMEARDDLELVRRAAYDCRLRQDAVDCMRCDGTGRISGYPCVCVSGEL